MLDRLHLRWQVVLCVALLQAVALALAAAVLVHNARAAVTLEMAAAEQSARAQVIAAVGAAMRSGPPDAVLPTLSEQLVSPRHVRLALFDSRTGRLPSLGLAGEEPHETAPAWFRTLVMPTVRETRLSIVENGVDHGFVSITTAPGDEIAEVWQDASALIWTMGAGFAATLAVLIALIGRALRPLDTLNAGLRALRGGELSTRISGIRGPDFGPLVAGFNTLSESLQKSEAERAAMARKIVALGDAERRAIAMELHDEFGPCLFGLKVKAGAITRAAVAAGDAQLRRDAETVTSIVDQIQAANTRLLTTLRPMTIGQLSLVEALEDMLEGFRSTHPGLRWRISLPARVADTEEIFDLTVYRCVQEGVTNALRHGDPQAVRVCLTVSGTDRRELDLVIEDDGRGIAPTAVEGRGLTAMRDRVGAVGGRLELASRPRGGTRLAVTLPMSSPAEAPGILDTAS
ncbi:two-component system, NarL family, sensor histidine kinase UhpB [Rhodovulum sp. ES.010]|uniref:ATP-binding protein n=1 Tax=Rhodovulum sp. ES.010 TaxID=1882821 RepID=UPI0009263BDB|nr:ATP-binding protein [Rhodovulum sp. ES.010]SIO30573.1 two-component system, NarL family, sensor histidine kinase UhpB [Rhodovulum sp. ES.010]